MLTWSNKWEECLMNLHNRQISDDRQYIMIQNAMQMQHAQKESYTYATKELPHSTQEQTHTKFPPPANE
jgi:hypothetical protein